MKCSQFPILQDVSRPNPFPNPPGRTVYWEHNGELYAEEPTGLPSIELRRKIWEAHLPGVSPEGEAFEVRVPAGVAFDRLVLGPGGSHLRRLQGILDDRLTITWRYENPVPATATLYTGSVDDLPFAKVVRFIVISLKEVQWRDPRRLWFSPEHPITQGYVVDLWERVVQWLVDLLNLGTVETLMDVILRHSHTTRSSGARILLRQLEEIGSAEGNDEATLEEQAVCEVSINHILDQHEMIWPLTKALDMWVVSHQEGLTLNVEQRILLAESIWRRRVETNCTWGITEWANSARAKFSN